MRLTTIAALTALFLIAHSSAQTTWHVDDDACPGPGAGTPGDPFCSIQAGIDAALDGDTVVVEPGTYFESINFNGKAITVRSTDPTDDGVVSSTIIDSDWTAVAISSGEGPETVLSGFFITAHIRGLHIAQSSPTVVRCTFDGILGTPFNHGNGIGIQVGSPTVRRCTFSNNRHGIISEFASPTVVRCTFVGNSTWLDGAGMYVGDDGATVISSAFIGNFAGDGGALYIEDEATVTNCTFVGNDGVYGGGVYSIGGPTVITNCTFTGNSALLGTAVYNDSGEVLVRNCIVWEDGQPLGWPWLSGGDPVIVQSSLVNAADPMFVDAANGDYRLLPGSPAIDAANPGFLPSDVTDLDDDGDVDEPLPLDLDDNPRVSGVSLDMGAYEFICPDSTADCNGNGVPDECEPDCNGNGIPDACDMADGTSADCNGNGLPDECDIAEGTSVDCNGNGVPDNCDMADGTSADCNGNGLPDDCDIAEGTSADCDGNSVPDECEYGDPLTGFALDFDDVDARVTMADFAGFPTDAITVSLWMRTTGDQDGIFSYAASDANNAFLLFAPQDLTVWINGSSISTGIDLADGTWHHLAVTWRGDTGATVVIVDGVAQFAGIVQPGVALGDGGTLVLGQDQDCVGGCFDPEQAFPGELDEVRVWNVVRFSEEIDADRNVGLVGNEPGLVGYWPMDEGAGGVVEDLAGENDGLISGAGWVATSTSPCCPGDIDGNGAVDVGDLVEVILAWGTDDSAADVNADGIIDVQDLVEVILAWGLCD